MRDLLTCGEEVYCKLCVLSKVKYTNGNCSIFWTCSGLYQERQMTETAPLEPSSGWLKPLLAISCVFLPVSFVGGAMFSQSAGMLPQLAQPDSFIQVTSDEASWIASLSSIGTLISTFVGGTLSDVVGRVRAAQVSFVFFAIGYGVVAAADRVMMILLGRFLVGIGFGLYIPAIVYVSEIAPPANRGLFLSLCPLMSSVGLVYMEIIGGYLPWTIASAITCLLSVIFLCLSFVCHDSPPWLVRRNKIEAARKSLQWLEHPLNVEAKLKELQDLTASQAEDEPVSIKTFMEPTVWKPFIMVAVLAVLQNASGFYIIIYYTVDFMAEFHSSFDPLEITVGIGIVRLISTILSSYFLGIMGRKTIGAISGFASAVLLLLIFAYLTLEKIYPGLSDYSWIPITLFLCFILTVIWGIYTLPWTLPYEVFPLKVRGAMCGLSFAVTFLAMFIAVKSYYVLVDNLGLEGMILMFAVVSAVFGVISVTVLVETHQKTLEEVEQKFSRKKNDEIAMNTLKI